MKLSELPYREYIALEVLPQFVGTIPNQQAVWRAFGVADEFLKAAGKFHDQIADAEERADLAETQYSILLNMGDDVPARIALSQIRELLGGKNQTETMQRLNQWRDIVASAAPESL